MNRTLSLLAFTTFFLTSRVAGQDAISVRASLPATPDQIYPSMLRFAEREDWPRLNTAISTLRPLLEFTDDRRSDTPGAALLTAVDSENPADTEVALLWFAVAAIDVHLLDVMGVEQPGNRRLALRQGFAEYLAIEPKLKSFAFAETRAIGNLFRRLHQASADPDAMSAIAAELIGVLASVVRGHGGVL